MFVCMCWVINAYTKFSLKEREKGSGQTKWAFKNEEISKHWWLHVYTCEKLISIHMYGSKTILSMHWTANKGTVLSVLEFVIYNNMYPSYRSLFRKYECYNSPLSLSLSFPSHMNQHAVIQAHTHTHICFFFNPRLSQLYPDNNFSLWTPKHTHLIR